MGADDLLLLYTDGLVERPGRTVNEGLGQVVKAIADAIPAVSDQPLTQLLAGLHQANPEDDTCVLAARSLASPSEPHQTGMSSSGARNSRRLPKQSAL
jgi:serine phosphatase RsbU (regulator of sigma subunit)